MEGAVSSKSDGKEENVNLEVVSLRPFDLPDLDDVMLWASDEKVAKFCSWEPCTSKEDGINFIKKAIQIPWSRAICLDNRAIGSVLVQSYSGNDECRAKSAELGFNLGSKYWDKGIATPVVKFVAKTIFSELPQLGTLKALIDVENVGSQRVLEKAGFQREGVLRNYLFMKGKSRDMVMYILLSTDSPT